ncbi:SET domain [Dillenia turbinata]|uniref:SET domain n=1 Tax=Dillenia turbinata TaxID=194707 RepID=A0AAN8UWF7_9MAGN
MEKPDAQFKDGISALLRPPTPLQEYFEELISTRKCQGLRVNPDGEFGKGVYATAKFGEGDLVLKDPVLVGAQHSSNKMDCLVCSYCFCFIGSVELQIGRKLYLQRLGISKDCCQFDSSDGEDDSYMEDHINLGESSSSNSDKTPLPNEVVESLMNGELTLPYSERYPLASVIPCPGGCGENYYCSKSCADSDWEFFHSLLCPGEKSESRCREALLKFIQHATETNDIFLLAAKAISYTILRYRKLKASYQEDQKYAATDCACNSDLSLLLEAWNPLSMGFKRRWWDCIALPDDVDYCDEAAFRMQIKELAFKSVQLLKAAIFDKDFYGHIIGMFEQNNLDLVVASPVEDYFLYIDDLPDSEKGKAEKITRPYLDALGGDYSVCCQGSAFYPLQSCMNHSCSPNARAFKREEDRDGQATIIATRPIHTGEEVTISYIDENLLFEERQALLADYVIVEHNPGQIK